MKLFLRQYAAALAGVAALVVAALLAVVAVQVQRWENAVRSGDLAYAADVPGRSELWASAGGVSRPVRALLGVGDDLQFRRAMELFRLSRVTQGRFNQGWEQLKFHGEAMTTLARVKRKDDDPIRRSRVSNLLGIAAFEPAREVLLTEPSRRATPFGRAPTQEELQRAQARLRRSIEYFGEAVRLDPRHEQAKFNLEFVLRVDRQLEQREREGLRIRRRRSGEAGSGRVGGGY